MNLTRKTKLKRLLNRLDGKIVLKRRPTFQDVKEVVEKSDTLQKSRFSYVLGKVYKVKPEIKLETKVIEIIKPELRTEIKEIVREVELDTKELKRLEDKIDLLRDRLNNLGGGSMNRQIKVNGVDVLTRYTDINLVGSITTADDNVDKNVDLTFASGSISFETPVGTVDDSNMIFTVSNEPTYINVNGLIYTVGNGAYTSYVAGTITLNTPVGVGGFIESAYV